MRIAQVAPAWIAIPPKTYGGTETVIYHLVEEQVAQGHDVTLYAPADASTSAKQISFFPKALQEKKTPWQAYLKAHYHLYRAIEHIKEQKYDIVHTHLSSAADMCLFLLTRDLGISHVMTLHSNFPFDLAPGWSGDADHYYVESSPSTHVIAISESARAQQPLPLNIAGVVHHGVSLDTYRPTNRRQGNYFAWLGRFSPEKGPHLAIEAARRAQVPLVLAGTIDRSSKETQAYFTQKIKPQFDNEQIRYIGPVNMQEKIRLLSRARAFLNPIEWEEPFGMVMIEAMALGCPVISFARGAAPEIVVNGQTGFLVQNIDEMVGCIPRIDEISREETRAHVEQRFSVSAMAKKYTQIYQKIIQADKKEHIIALSKDGQVQENATSIR